ncbi:MAG: FadR family transcriptional regulator [Cohaesibacter sp.]|nr:FadR family transcriptional regulator [Cohaesibacter sp.]MCV6603100.1 FadR family transcriptional regulator [Cohaesibacter sp.]
MIFRAISQNRTSDAVIDQIERLILEGVLRSGDQLPAERELASKLDVSRPVLRTALKDLEERNLIRTQHGGGTFVANVVGTVFSDEVFELIRRHPKAHSDYFEFRRDLEGVTAEHAARRATDADKLILTRIMDVMRQHHAEGDIHKESEADFEFHQAIVEASHNMLMLHTLRSCYKLLAEGLFYSRIRLYEWPGVQDALLEQHERLYKAIMEGKPDEAREAARHHMDYVEQTLTHTNQAGVWEEISRMRLSQLADRSDKAKRAKKTSHSGRSNIRPLSKVKRNQTSVVSKLHRDDKKAMS